MFGQQLSNFLLLEQQGDICNTIEDFTKPRSFSSESQSTEDYETDIIHNQYESISLAKAEKYSLSEQKPNKNQDFQQKMKTELCKNFIYTGICRFGGKCSFAHGYDELQSKTYISSNYKTKPCKSFFGTGYCQYGERCQFLHSEIKYSIQSANLKQYQQKVNTLNLIGNQSNNILQFIGDKITQKSTRSGIFKNREFNMNLNNSNN